MQRVLSVVRLAGYYDGNGLGWHFDRSEFGVNLVLQVPRTHNSADVCGGSERDGPHSSRSRVALLSIVTDSPSTI